MKADEVAYPDAKAPASIAEARILVRLAILDTPWVGASHLWELLANFTLIFKGDLKWSGRMELRRSPRGGMTAP